ncbi:M23 family metallopeptidase [Jiella pacifica]|uniref:Peptidoglycan DD-metalloendopeptidase family protein n=1 Tax=Jiella pacifica TaxID=2696469 RepID=A0A6N9TAC5_9HYPH|nr:M23 family metallopeptidase [Jiella pacifica]NDW07006.1 peptidoglycan DD-metalloendopeptidase family protein [Jiella pacifica]
MNRTRLDGLSLRPDLGDEPALVADRRRRPDKRQVSARWLAGTLLTGVTSTTLMGIALSAALDGHQGAARPAVATAAATIDGEELAKGERVVATALPVARSRQIMELSTLTRKGDREVLRTLPFGYVNMLLAARYPATTDYPSFDPLKVYATDEGGETATEEDEPAKIYGARVESEVRLKVSSFDFDPVAYQRNVELDAAAAENLVRSVAPRLGSQPVQVASLGTVDPFRFGLSPDPAGEYEPGSAFRVVAQNVSYAVADTSDDRPRFHEEIVPFRQTSPITDMLSRAGHDDGAAKAAVEALAEELGKDTLEPGDALRIGVETPPRTNADEAPPKGEVVRLSAYRAGNHLATVAATRDGPFEPSQSPEMSDSVTEAIDENESEAPIRGDMPTIYDGLFQAALSYGLDVRMCQQLTNMLATDVDLQSRLSPSDRLVVFYSMTKDGDDEDPGELLYVEVHVGDFAKRYYRFRPTKSGVAGYFDEDGQSAGHFLLRKPVPNARFTSGFSAGRKHPVLGYNRPHWGVDWAAPRGSAILAAADGIVTKVGWESGYGRHTELRHANGYETTYSHQSGFAKKLKVGQRVRQGQVIGYVGSTGLSTGNHLHFEVHVNGKPVDAMRIKIPPGQTLEGEDLVTFKRERNRIDALLEEHVDAPLLAAQ